MKQAEERRSRPKLSVLDEREMRAILRRMAGELIERYPDLGRVKLVGIRTRGVPLAERLAAEIAQMEGQRLPIGMLDITFYRDDLQAIGPQPEVKGSHLPFEVDDQIIVLCDDVLYTGRTVRAALDELADYGRPRAARLAVLIDRGHRELPIQADIVGKTVPTSRSEFIEVAFTETDGRDSVTLRELLSGDAT